MISKRYDHLLRLLLVGETGVGKTCLLCRFSSDDFISSHISTIGIDFKMKMMDIDGQTVKVQVWDTAGQERFEAITKQFYRRAQNCKEHTVVTLIGNKTDKLETRQVTFLEAQTFADQNSINFYEVSAKDRNNVDKPFRDVCRAVLQHESLTEPERENTSITIDTQVQTEGSTQEGPGTSVVGSATSSQTQANWCCSIS
ncbi:ras-related protein Rab-15-like isoform X2 [Dreissena polymorpha]|uniref:ras-related protein Rab-15-like isoform X2 n=1 Tax=Dreissena polymorpha TaxID=45954 RepID=UPI0022643B0E|nr:ras-related protein Rab-15-like isoform X2 [Dreissena polymorpha]